MTKLHSQPHCLHRPSDMSEWQRDPTEPSKSQITPEMAQVKNLSNEQQFQLCFTLANYNLEDLEIEMVSETRILKISGNSRKKMGDKLLTYRLRYSCEIPADVQLEVKADWDPQTNQLIVVSDRNTF